MTFGCNNYTRSHPLKKWDIKIIDLKFFFIFTFAHYIPMDWKELQKVAVDG